MESWTQDQVIAAAITGVIAAIGWGLQMSGYVNKRLGQSLMVAGVLGLFATVIGAIWPARPYGAVGALLIALLLLLFMLRPAIRRISRVMRRRRATLEIGADIRDIPALHGPYTKGRGWYAVLTVLNNDRRVWERATARLVYMPESDPGRSVKGNGVWSSAPGPVFVPGGGIEADLVPGSPRLLVVAMTLGQYDWLALTEQDIDLDPFDPATSDKPGAMTRTKARQLRGTVGLTVTIRSSSRNQVESYRLGARPDGRGTPQPAISRPSLDPPPTTAG